MENNTFSKRLIKIILLKENRISLKDINLSRLSKKIEVPAATFHQWLSGAFPKRIEHWKKLHKYFDCDLNFLITGIPFEKKDIPQKGGIINLDGKKRLLEGRCKVGDNFEIMMIRT